jgi:3-oxoacyl-[acyl-carrier protein] reductase
MTRLAGQIALVTGAASGFGRGIAEAFAAEGAAVLVTDIDGESAERVAGALAEQGARAAACVADVSDRASLDRAVALCEETFGGLSVLVANAGLGQRPAAFAETEAETLRRQYEINAIGAMQTCQAGLPALRRRGEGTSILITVSGIALVPRPALYGYGMAKAAAAYMMKSLALELAPERIRVNGLFPAIGDTPMLAEFAGGERTAENATTFANALPLGRLITPGDVGAAAVFLSAPREAGAMTGCVLTVDAGRCI